MQDKSRYLRGSGSPEAKPSSKKEPRASCAVMPAWCSVRGKNQDPAAGSAEIKNKKGFAYGQTSARGSGSGRRSKSYSLLHEREPPPPPKCSMSYGKNIVKFHHNHAELIERVMRDDIDDICYREGH